MKYRNKILKSLILVDLEKDIIINNDSNNEALLSKKLFPWHQIYALGKEEPKSFFHD